MKRGPSLEHHCFDIICVVVVLVMTPHFLFALLCSVVAAGILLLCMFGDGCT